MYEPVKSTIHPDELNSKRVQFQFLTDSGPVWGIGRFSAQRNENGSDYVWIIFDAQTGSAIHEMTYPLTQELVELIQPHPDPSEADFRCLARV